MYLRDNHEWSYSYYGNGRAFMDNSRFMLFERREDMSCESFRTKEKITTKDAKYIVITLKDFLQHSDLEDERLFSPYNEAKWSFPFIKLGLKVVRNAEIVIPTKEIFPLIIRNQKYNFYVAGIIEDG